MSRKVTLKPISPKGDPLRLHLVGDDQLTGGVGTWSIINRPRRRDAIEYTGTTGFVYTLPLLLDGTEVSIGRDQSVEPDVRLLQSWSGKRIKATRQPTVLHATGPLKTAAGLEWVITGLEWGAQIRNAKGKRVQQFVTVTLTQYTQAAVRKSPAKRARERKGKD